MMKYEDIEIGRKYKIDFDDPDYPCDCDCHTDNNILHCEPCCEDKSYHGIATCVEKLDEQCIFSVPQSMWFYVLSPDSVLCEM